MKAKVKQGTFRGACPKIGITFSEMTLGQTMSLVHALQVRSETSLVAQDVLDALNAALKRDALDTYIAIYSETRE